MTMPGQDYAGDFEDTFSARAGFVWKLGKSLKPTQISLGEKEKMFLMIFLTMSHLIVPLAMVT